MKFIIYDLEATCWENRRSRKVETIEIGAVKLSEFGEVESTFCKFIKPILNPFLSPFCMNLTSISQIQINQAATFPVVIEQFQDWIEIYDEEYLLCSWGNFDQTQLIKDCELHDIEDDWLDDFINLKAQYSDMKNLSKPYGLKKAVKREGFEFEGTHHRGIDDAYNLAKIFGKYFDVWGY